MARDKTFRELLDDITAVDGVFEVALYATGRFYYAEAWKGDNYKRVGDENGKHASPVLALQALIVEAKLPVTFTHPLEELGDEN